jgi:hypothetical protein
MAMAEVERLRRALREAESSAAACAHVARVAESSRKEQEQARQRLKLSVSHRRHQWRRRRDTVTINKPCSTDSCLVFRCVHHDARVLNGCLGAGPAFEVKNGKVRVELHVQRSSGVDW